MRHAVVVLIAVLFLGCTGQALGSHEPVGACSPGFTNVKNVDL
jgi:hypothetical protein